MKFLLSKVIQKFFHKWTAYTIQVNNNFIPKLCYWTLFLHYTVLSWPDWPSFLGYCSVKNTKHMGYKDVYTGPCPRASHPTSSCDYISTNLILLSSLSYQWQKIYKKSTVQASLLFLTHWLFLHPHCNYFQQRSIWHTYGLAETYWTIFTSKKTYIHIYAILCQMKFIIQLQYVHYQQLCTNMFMLGLQTRNSFSDNFSSRQY